MITINETNSKKITYVGYDLGDGTGITDQVTLIRGESTSKTVFNDMTMPGTTIAGRAIPTAFAYDKNGNVIFSQTITANPEEVKNITVSFKRRPTDLLNYSSENSVTEQIDLIRNFEKWPSVTLWPEGNTTEMIELRDSVISFTNAIFTNKNYAAKIRSTAQDSEEIVFCVGHPTNWSELDVAIYELIMRSTVLGAGEYEGKPTSIIMEAESRAAFLYSKDVDAFAKLDKDLSVLLIDVGSSTIDITALSMNCHNYLYNSGNNYLGARSIDYMILNWYLDKLQQQPALWDIYQALTENNPSINNALVLACRHAKEELFSSTSGMSVIYFSTFPGMRITAEDLDNLIENSPVAGILKDTINLNDDEYSLMGEKNWKEAFKDFLSEKKVEMENKGIRTGHIILTGGASQMPFVPQVISEVFDEVSSDSLIYDMDPSRTISKGLALVGPANEKSSAFQKDLDEFIEQKLENIVEDNIPVLSEKIGEIVSDSATPVMKSHILSWRNGEIDTLNHMNELIKYDCSEENMTKLLSDNKKYNAAIRNWLKDDVGKDIAVGLKGLCDKYGVRNLTLNDLNIMEVPEVTFSGVNLDPLEFMDTIGIVLGLISGIIAAAATPTIVAIVLAVISIISESLAITLFGALCSNPATLVTVVPAVLCISVAVLIGDGFEKLKDVFSYKVMDYNLPKVARIIMTDAKINKCLVNTGLCEKIKEAFLKEEMKKNIVKKVSLNLREQIEKRAEEIKYAIESK